MQEKQMKTLIVLELYYINTKHICVSIEITCWEIHHRVCAVLA